MIGNDAVAAQPTKDRTVFNAGSVEPVFKRPKCGAFRRSLPS